MSCSSSMAPTSSSRRSSRRDQAGNAAVLVEHDGDLGAPGAELVEQLVGVLGLGDAVGGADQRARADAVRAVGVGHPRKEVLGVEDADDVVAVLADRAGSGSGRSRGRCGPRPRRGHDAGRVTIAERGVISSETSRRVSSTACWISCADRFGELGLARSSSWSPSAGISTSTLAGRGGRRRGVAQRETRVSPSRRRRDVNGAVRNRRTPPGGQRRSIDPLGVDLADDPRQHVAQPPARTPRRTTTRTPGRVAQLGRAPRRRAGPPGKSPVTTARASAASSVASSWCATSSARSGRPRSAQTSSSRLRE